jgi:Uma2 family endonuclease
LVSEDQYLSTSYRPDRELIDGELVERNTGEYEHSNLQTALSTRLRIRQREWKVRGLIAQRIRVAPGQFRVPDICIVSRDLPVQPVFTRPPIVCIEILSKDDSLRGMQKRVDDYLNFGVPNIWILDPSQLLAYVCSYKGFQQPEAGVLEVPSSPIRIPLEDLFADLD